MTVNGQISFWYQQLGEAEPFGPAVAGTERADVAIIGAGYTGLWTAYHLLERDPSLSIAIIEQRVVGYGASSRNGGWVTNSITAGLPYYAGRFGEERARAFQHVFNRAVDDIIAVAEVEGIDAGFVKGGSLMVARNAAQLARLESFEQHIGQWPEEGFVRLSEAESRARVDVAGTVGGAWQPHCARVQPAALCRGLAQVLAARGVRFFEGSRVVGYGPGEVTTVGGRVLADRVLRATEGYTAQLRGHRRDWAPVASSMVITEPLGAEVWEQIGWSGYETIEDFAHVYVYLQRTPDGRIAIGGRGNPYRYASQIRPDGEVDQPTIDSLVRSLHEFFPATASARIDHAWGGVLAVPRTWRSSVDFDAVTGVGHAGGYVGTGVTATHVAARSLADLALGLDTEHARLPWVGERSRQWEPEPLRWAGVQGIYALYRMADAAEARGRATTSPWARLADRIAGRTH